MRAIKPPVLNSSWVKRTPGKSQAGSTGPHHPGAIMIFGLPHLSISEISSSLEPIQPNGVNDESRISKGPSFTGYACFL